MIEPMAQPALSPVQQILAANYDLCAKLASMRFSEPVTHVYNPLAYAARPHQAYLRRYADSRKKVLFLGMNPGPWGMAQTGVPFGEIAAVREWIKIEEIVARPANEHPKRPIEGFACQKSEVSGRRLWGLFAERFGDPGSFFRDHLVLNYCPLVFMEQSGKNRTPDKLPASEMEQLQDVCDARLLACIRALRPEWLIGVGVYAEQALKRVAEVGACHAKTGRILHPSPASPAANRGWAAAAARQLGDLGVW